MASIFALFKELLQKVVKFPFKTEDIGPKLELFDNESKSTNGVSVPSEEPVPTLEEGIAIGEKGVIPVIIGRELTQSQLQKMYDEYMEDMRQTYKERLVKGILLPGDIFATQNIPWDKTFVPLKIKEKSLEPIYSRLSEEVQVARETTISERKWIAEQHKLEIYRNQIDIDQTERKLLRIVDILDAGRFVVLGELGAGKSTMLQYIMYAIVYEDYTHVGEKIRGKLPIFVEIGNYAEALKKKRDLQLVDYICQHRYEEFAELISVELEKQNCVVLLDGLDEVEEIGWRRKVTKGIEDLAIRSRYSGNCFVVTSRPAAYLLTPLAEDFSQGFINKLQIEDIRVVATDLYEVLRAKDWTIPEDEPQRFMNALESQPEARDLAANPLLLTGLLLMHYRRLPLPNRRVEIYEYLTKTLLITWKPSLRKLKWNEKKLLWILASVAFQLRDTSSSDKATQKRILGWIQEKLRYPREDAEDDSLELLTCLSEQIGILIPGGVKNGHLVYEFPQKFFVQFLAALQLKEKWRGQVQIENGKTQFLSSYLHHDRWQEVLRLMVAHLSTESPISASQLLMEIKNFDDGFDKYLKRNLLFVGECLGEDVELDEEKLPAEDLIRELVNLLKDDVDQLRWEAARVLTGLRGTQYQPIAIEMLKQIVDTETEVHVKWVTADILIALGKYEIAKPLLHDFVKFPTGEYSFWALHRLLINESQEEKINLLKQLIQRKDEDIAFRLQGEVEAKYTSGWFMYDKNSFNMIAIVDEESLKELAVVAKKDACTTKMKEQGDWILWQLPNNSSPEIVRRLAKNAKDEFIRHLAALQLAKLETQETAIHILENMAEEGEVEASYAARGLNELGKTDRATQILRGVVWNISSDYPSAAIERLAMFNVPELVIPMVLEFYLGNKINEEENQWRVINALVHVCPGELATELWLDIAQQDDHLYRYEAAEALLETDKKEAAIATLKGIINRKGEVDRDKAVKKLIDLYIAGNGKELRILKADLEEMAKQPCSPYKMYWIKQSLARLGLLIESNGSSQAQMPETESTNGTLRKIANRQQLYKTAMAKLDELIEKNQNNVDAWLARARILKLQKQDQDKEVLDALNQVIEQATSDDWIQLTAAIMYKELGKKDQALEVLHQLRKSTNDPNICVGVAGVLLELGDELEKENALSALEHAKQLAPENVEVLVKVALQLFKYNEKREDAINTLKLAIDLRSKEDKEINWLGVAERFTELREKNEATDAVDKAIAIEAERVETLVHAAEILIKLGQKDEKDRALQFLRQAKKLDSKNPWNWIKIAELLHQCNAPTKEVVETLEIATKLAPEWVDVWVRKAQTFVNFEHYEDAKSASQKAIELNPQDVYAWDRLGDAYYEGKNYEKAMEIYRKVRDINPNHAYPWVGIGDTHLQQENPNEAEEAFRKATDLDPNYAYAWQRLGYACTQQKEYEQAEAAYRKVTNLKPQSIVAWTCLGDIYNAQKRYKEAKDVFQKLTELNSKDHENWYNLGVAHVNLKDYTKAVEAFQKATELNNDNADYRISLGLGNHVLGYYEKAIIAYKEAIDCAPDNPSIYDHLGFAYVYQGSYDQAADIYRKAIEIEKNDKKKAYLLSNLGNAYRYSNRFQDAEAAYQRAKELDPNGSNINLGLIHMRLGNWADAESVLKKDCETATQENYVPFVNLGVVHCRLGMKADSPENFEEALRRCMECLDEDFHTQLSEAWLQVVTGKIEVGLRALQTILNEMPPSPGLLIDFIWDTDSLIAIPEPLLGLAEMRNMLIEAKATWEAKLKIPNQTVPEHKE